MNTKRTPIEYAIINILKKQNKLTAHEIWKRSNIHVDTNIYAGIKLLKEKGVVYKKDKFWYLKK